MTESWGTINATSIDEARAMINVPLRRDRMQWVETATPDAIRQFCLGVGEDNPLWGDQFAPPSFLYAVDATIVAPKLPGVQWIYAGTRWRWFDRLRTNDTYETSARLTRVDEKTGRRFGSWVLQTGEVQYRRDSGDLVAVAEGRVARTPRRDANTEQQKDGEKTDKKPDQKLEDAPVVPTPSIERPDRRGTATRRWESVTEGDEIGVVHRTLQLEDIYRWYMGAQGALHYGGAHADAVRYRHRHDDFEINAETGAKDAAARGHFSARVGKDVGMGGAYDVGPHRISWIIAMLTDWLGDHGFLAELEVNILKPNLVGDTTRLNARVSRCWKGSHSLVSLEVEGVNQWDVLTTNGSAIVALPCEQGPVKLPLLGGDPARSLQDE